MQEEHGYNKGEICNREGCRGIIDEHDKDGCSCHSAPPCSSCTRTYEYCPECDWDHQEEIEAEYAKRTIISDGITYILPKRKTIDDLDKSKIDWFHSGGWHSGTEITGVYPEGTTREDILRALRIAENPNMPRFKRFSDGIFTLTYFTD
jgi:hypothetical protein